jgi:hypothetical protein
MLVLAAVAGWTFDDWCGTPPRPWPHPPGPWPWLRKGLAVIGAIGGAIIFGANTDLTSIIIVGGVSGAFLASAGQMLGGGRAVNAG